MVLRWLDAALDDLRTIQAGAQASDKMLSWF